MTEQLFPDDMANGLVDGTLPADDVPAEARALADVLRAAHQSASSEELSGMAAMVQQFTAEVTVPATTHRSSSMFATRLTRRAAAMVAVTLLAAGTAAASAGGALPSPFSAGESSFGAFRPDDEATTTTTEGVATTTTEAGGEVTTTTEGDATTTTETSMPETSTTLDPEAPLVPIDVLDEMQAANPSLFGKCTAWTNGAPKNPEVPGFVELQVAADEVGITIDEFCDELLDARDDADDADDADHDGDADHDDDAESDKGDKSDHGNDKGDKGDHGNDKGDHGNDKGDHGNDKGDKGKGNG